MSKDADWRMTDKNKGHHWGFWKKDPYQCCRLCGVVRRADDKNSPCRGKVQVVLR